MTVICYYVQSHLIGCERLCRVDLSGCGVVCFMWFVVFVVGGVGVCVVFRLLAGNLGLSC